MRRLFSFILVCVCLCLVGGCAKSLKMKALNGLVEIEFESRAAKSYRVLSYVNEKKETAFDLLYFDSEDELLACEVCEECDAGCEPPPINPDIEDGE